MIKTNSLQYVVHFKAASCLSRKIILNHLNDIGMSNVRRDSPTWC